MNNQFPADHELKQYSALANGLERVLIQTNELEKTSRAIFSRLFDALLKNDKVLLISSDPSITDRVYSLLELFNLHSYSKNLKENRPINTSELSAFQKANIPTKALSENDLQIMESFLKKEEADLIKNYHALQQKVFGKKSILSIIETYQKAKYFTKGDHSRLNIDTKGFDFNHDEFWKLRKEIQTCIDFFNPIFNTLDKSNVISVGMVKKMADQENLDLLKIELNQKITSIDGLIDNLSSYLNSQINGLYNEKLLLKKRILNQLKTLREQLVFIKYHESNQKQSILGIKKKSKFDLSPLQHKMDACLNELEQDPYFLKITKPLIRDLTQENLEKIIAYVQNLEIEQGYFSNYAQRLNVNHMSSEERDKIQSRLMRFIEKLNNSDFFAEEFELSDFTIQHQIDSLKTIKNKLRSISDLNEQLPSYVKWSVHFNQISQNSKSIIDQFRNYNLENWLHLYEAWYIEQVIIKNKNITRSIDQHSFDYLLNLTKVIQQENLAFISNQRSQSREEAKQNLKRKDKTSFKQLFGNQPSNHSLAKLYRDHSFLMTEYWPIVFTIPEQVKFLNATDNNYDLVIIIEPDEKHIAEYKEVMHSNSNIHIFKSPANPIDLSQIALEFSDEQTISFSTAYPNIHASESSESIGEKLKSAKRLAQNLVAINPEFNIYQTKNLSIISYWSSFKNKNLEAELESEFIKKIEDSKDENSITEALLVEDKQIIVLLENGLINAKTPENYNWQIHILQGLQLRAVECYNYFSSELYFEGDDHFKSLLNLIKSSGVNEEDVVLQKELTSDVT